MDRETLISELQYKAVRSSGKGGQHVNKVSTKVELHFDLENSRALTVDEKNRLKISLKKRLNKEQKLILQSSETRSQLKNKEIVTRKFLEIILTGLKQEKKRIPTKLPKSVKLKRLDDKKRHSDKKLGRQKPKLD